MKRYIFILAILSLSAPAVAEVPPYSVVTDVIYGHKAGMALTYDVLIPKDSLNGAGIIHIVSSGWKSRQLPIDSVEIFYAPILQRGYTLFILRHGSSPYFKVPDMVEDVQRAVEHIAAHASEYGVDADRLGIYGGSAGGQLALMTGTMHEDPPVAAVVAFFAPSQLSGIPSFARKMYPAIDIDSAALASVSPINYVSHGDAPTLLIHGDLDFVVPTRLSDAMYDTLVEHRVPTRYVLVEGMFHGGTFGGKGKFFDRTTGEMLNWFDTYLLPSAKADPLSAEINNAGGN